MISGDIKEFGLQGAILQKKRLVTMETIKLSVNDKNTACHTADLNSAHSNYTKTTVCQLLTRNV